jgi:uncharacterized protein (TIGR02996 family)
VTSEDDFAAMLDADPFDEFTRLVFADWLGDHDKPEAEAEQRALAVAYAALVALKLSPGHDEMDGPWDTEGAEECWLWWTDVQNEPQMREQTLPRDWFELLPDADGHYVSDNATAPKTTESKDFYTRRAAVDSAALAFVKLPAARRAELLSVVCSGA